MSGPDLLVGGPVVLPLLAAGLSFLLSRASWAQRGLGVLVLAAVVGDAAYLLFRADRYGPVAIQAGGFRAPLGITLVADRLSALVLLSAGLVLLLVLVYAIGQGAAERRVEQVPSVFHPAFLVLTAGIALAFLTGDLFTLFVAFEVLLMASYVLLTLGATRERVRAGMVYTVSSLVASIMLLTTIGLIYGVTGTVNLADLAGRTAALDPGMRQLLSLMLLLAIGIKAAVVPLHWWLPDSYPTAPAPVTVVFAALLTKVGVYAILRTQTLLFPRDHPWTLVLVLAAVTMLVGVAGALVQEDLNRVLSFTLVAHVGFMLFGLGLSTEAGLAGAIIYLVHHIAVQANLFLSIGLVERERGSTSMARLGGVAAAAPLLAVVFVVPALSVAGVPPFSGFIGKLALLRAAVAQGGTLALGVAGMVLVVSLLTLVAMIRIWLTVFWGEPKERVADESPADLVDVGVTHRDPAMRGAAVAAVAAGLALVVFAGPLTSVSSRAASDLGDLTPYRTAVLGGTP